jgi:hypothetical protein
MTFQPRSVEADRGLVILPGANVLDLETGQGALVTAGRVEHNPPRHILSLTLSDGGRVERTPDQVIALPPGLAVPLDHFEGV